MSNIEQIVAPSPANLALKSKTKDLNATISTPPLWMRRRYVEAISDAKLKSDGVASDVLTLGRMAISSGVAGWLFWNDFTLRSHTFQEFEEVTVGGKDKGRIFSDYGLVGLHGPCEFIECYRFRALIVSSRIDFSGFRVCYAADFLNLAVGFRLDLVQVA